MVGVGHIEQGVVVDGGIAGGRGVGALLVDVGGGQLDSAQGAVIAAVRVSYQGEVDRHAGPDLGDVRLRDLRLDRHGVQVGELEQGRDRLAGGQGLPLAGHYADDCAIHGGLNAVIAELRLGALHLDQGVVDVRLGALQLGPGDGQLRLCTLQIGPGARLLPEHLLLAAPGQLVLLELRLLDLELGTAAGQFGLGGLEVVLGYQGIYLCQQIPLLDLLPGLHRQIGDLTRDLGPHIHLLYGLQGAAGQHRLLHVLTGHGRSQHGVRGLAGPGQPDHEGQQCQGKQGIFAWFWKSLHLSPERNE